MPEIGMKGQEKLKDARVLVVGAGGLGSPAAIYLAAGGIGTLGIIDDDTVSLSNLHRQPMHGSEDIGSSKTDSAEKHLRSLNPNVDLKMYNLRLTSGNALSILSAYDLVLDCTDNFPARYLINDASVLLGKPDIFGAVYRFEGQVTVFDAKDGPCYRCLHPLPPPSGLIPSCGESGVIGVLPGIIGTIQALEAMKLVLGTGDSLKGRLLYFDGSPLKFYETNLSKDPECIVCGRSPQIKTLIDYENWCTRLPVEDYLIAPSELKLRLDRNEKIFLLDVREPFEYDVVNLGGMLIPLGQLPSSLDEIDTGREIVVYCKSGQRSIEAVRILTSHGFQNVRSLAGGIDAWIDQVDPQLLKY
jgi:molybdopterin/thiamine biosynthesis adenylyltransferase/rhodanese-related sulfurtransferase